MTPKTLFETLCDNPADFEPFTALRIIEKEAQNRNLAVLVRSVPENRLTPLAITAIRVTDKAIEVESHLLSYTGPLSPLPPGYVEIAAKDQRRSGALNAFLDLFTDRLTWMFVMASEKYNLAARMQWSDSADNTILTALRALLGLESQAIKPPLPDDETLRFAGFLSQRTRSASGLRRMAEAELGLPVQLKQFQLVWRPLPQSDCAQLGGGLQLGTNAIAGTQIPDRSGQCRLVVGPVRYMDFVSLEKGQPRMERLLSLIKHYIPPGINFDIQVILDRRDVPQTQLGGEGLPAKLGWNTWARTEPALRDSYDIIIQPDQTDEGLNARAA